MLNQQSVFQPAQSFSFLFIYYLLPVYYINLLCDEVFIESTRVLCKSPFCIVTRLKINQSPLL
jgi:hypothetical protein